MDMKSVKTWVPVNHPEPVRVLHVVHKMHRAGMETLLMQIYRHMDRDKVQFDFLVHTDQPGHYNNEIRDLGGKIIFMPVLPSKDYFLYAKTLKNTLLINGPYSIIHSHLLLLSGIILGVAQSAHIPCRIAHSHSNSDNRAGSFGRCLYAWYMRRQIRRHATHMLAVSRPAGEWLFGKNCWQDSRVQILHNAIDLKPFERLRQDRSKTRADLGLPVDAILLGHIGRFEPSKNHRKVLEIFSSFAKLQPAAHLLLIGEGPLEGEVRSLIKSLGLQDQVHLLGVRSDIPELLNAMDLFLFPSLFEGLGIVLIEAQAAGVACLVSDTIPSEADLGLGLLKFLPLAADSAVWAGTALSLLSPSKLPWSTREKSLKQNHYDVSELAPELQKLYSHELHLFND
jgi:glycosyltransferase involved in cell wall biosynthesis